MAKEIGYYKEYDIEKLKPWKRNPRQNDEAVEKLVKVILDKNIGFVDPIIATPDGTIRAGHTRFKAALKAGLKTVPVKLVEFDSERDAIKYSILDNKIHESSFWDTPELLGLDHDYDLDLGDLGFTDADIHDLSEDEINNFFKDDTTDKPPKTATCPECGTVFEI